MALTLTDHNFREVVESQPAVLVDFWAPWCRPCNALSPILERIADRFPEITVAKLNIDENDGVTSEQSISSIPTLLFFRGGQLVKRLSGLRSENDIAKEVETVLLG
jgi:thioredoxin 1